MTTALRLTRATGDGRATPPVRIVSMGLGAFSRAHPGWYTDLASDAGEWGIAAFTGRRRELADALAAQEGLYTLVTRGPDRDRFDVVASLAEAHPAADHASWLAHVASPHVAIVLLTVTEAGYRADGEGRLDRLDPEVAADIEALRADLAVPVRSAPGRLVAGLAARRRADAGPVALVSCDNLPGNGALAGRVVRELAESVDPGLATWIDEAVSLVSTTADRITPRPTPADVDLVVTASERRDLVPVITEPFHDWVLEGGFPAGRPAWPELGAILTDDVVPYEHRKLWLLNGGHSLLAYLGLARGHATAAEALADDVCRGWLERWWDEAGPHLPLPADDVDAYRSRLLERLANPRIAHRLDQIAVDGSLKLPVRILPTVRAERAAGRVPNGAACVLAAWVAHLRDDRPLLDARAATLLPLAEGELLQVTRRVLAVLDGDLGEDDQLVGLVASAAAGIERAGTP